MSENVSNSARCLYYLLFRSNQFVSLFASHIWIIVVAALFLFASFSSGVTSSCDTREIALTYATCVRRVNIGVVLLGAATLEI